MNSASLCSLAGRYDDPIPARFLAPIDFLKIPAQNSYSLSECEANVVVGGIITNFPYKTIFGDGRQRVFSWKSPYTQYRLFIRKMFAAKKRSESNSRIDSRNRVWNWVAKIHRLAGRYDNPMPTWFLAPIAGLKLPTLVTKLRQNSSLQFSSLFSFNSDG